MSLNQEEMKDLKNMIAFYSLAFPNRRCKCSYTGELISIEEYCAELMIYNKNQLQSVVEKAAKDYHMRKEGWEPCHHLCFNLTYPEGDIDSVRQIIFEIMNWNNKLIKGSLFCVEFWSKQGTTWNPHIHFWVPKKGRRSKLEEAAKRKFGKFGFNIWCKDGHCNVKNYVMGKKVEGKDKSIAKDRDTREKHSVLHLYEIV